MTAFFPSYSACFSHDGVLYAVQEHSPGSAVLPADDRAFLYGDGIFETVRFGAHVPYAAYHEQRLKRGCDMLRIPCPAVSFTRLARILAKRNRINSGILRLHVSAGNGGRGYVRPKALCGRIIISLRPLPKRVTPARLLVVPPAFFGGANGLEAIKHTNRAASCIAASYAHARRYDDALFVNADGYVAECASSNLFAIFGSRIVTPPLSSGALAGSARQRVLERSPQAQERPLHLSELRKADVIFMSNAVTGLRRVMRVDGYGTAYRPCYTSPISEHLFRSLHIAEALPYAAG